VPIIFIRCAIKRWEKMGKDMKRWEKIWENGKRYRKMGKDIIG